MLQKLKKRIAKAKKEDLPFVIYNKPNSKKVSAFFQKDNHLNFQADFVESGFIFAPFDNKQPSIIFPKQKCEFFQEEIKGDVFKAKFSNLKTQFDHKNDQVERQKHITLVKKGINYLEENQALKVVLSRKEDIDIKSIDTLDIFINLLNNYPGAFVYLWYHPKIGLWMGASPETLLDVKNKHFETMALAGTQIFNGDLEIIWGDKEKEEQQIVTDYIVNQLTSFNLSVSLPFTKRAGNLAHICTEISGELKKSDHIGLLVEALHPTPAVCGLPKDKAIAFIIDNEKYNRQYYTGYLGELNIKENCHLFVNLRCMQIDKQKASLYIGGGITGGSNPEMEWEETVAKSEVMKRVLVHQ